MPALGNSASMPDLQQGGATSSSTLPARRLKNELFSGTATRAGVCLMPQMVIPNIATDDPRAVVRSNRIQRDLEYYERKLDRINRNAVGIGKRAVTIAVLQSPEAAAGGEMLPKQQMVLGGKPFICQPMKHNEVPTFAGDALFTSTNRASYYWKSKKRRDTKNRRPYDDFYKFRDAFFQQKACLRSVSSGKKGE